MTMKQPTIDDIYMADAYLTTPGVRQGLLERAADGNDDEVVTEDTDDGQVVYYRTPYGEMVPVGRPIMLAAAPTQTASDVMPSPVSSIANIGRRDEIKPFDPTVRQQLADFLQAGFEKFGMDRFRARKQAQTLMGGESSNLPLALGLADIVPFLGTALQTQEAARMGEEAVQSAQQGNLGTAAIQAGGAALGMIPGAAGTVKAARKVGGMAGEAIDQAMTQGTGPAARIIPQAVRPMNVVPPGPAAAPAAAVSDIGFYSAVEQAAMKTSRKAGPGQAFLNDILKGENVKADEVKWIGLDDFLKGKKNVTREEVQDFIRNNRVDVQEVQLGNEPTRWEGNTLLVDNKPVGEIKDSAGGYVWMKPDGTSTQLQSNRMFDAVDEVMKLTGVETRPQTRDTMPKFAKYTLPGGENYREILLTLPESFGAKPNKDGYTPLSAIGDAQYRSSHWDQPNVLAHIRVNDRVDADGKKMLLVEEVQSDWHQAGRDRGYKPADIAQRIDEINEQMNALAKQRDPVTNRMTDEPKWFDLARERDALVKQSVQQVPDAPMKDTWYQLALKRVLKYAADNGYERVGLTTGARQAERYDLSKQVDEITVPMVIQDGSRSVRIDPVKGSSIKLMVDADGTVTGFGAGSVQFSGKKLNEVIGKEMAEKVMAAAPDTKFSGLDLRVGGEGMKKYYDEVYPQFLAKYGKKWGASVGDTSIPIYKPGYEGTIVQRTEDVRYVDITPQMRESVSKGQPLFTAVPAGTAAAGATMQDKEQK